MFHRALTMMISAPVPRALERDSAGTKWKQDLSLSAKPILRQILWRAARVLRLLLIAYHENKAPTDNWDGEHPSDRGHGVRTSGMLARFLLRPGKPLDVPTTIHSAARQALATIPDPQHCRFLDVGCGKGWPFLVATGFRFVAIIGVELSPTLSRVARRNTDLFSRVHPDRAPIVVVVGDAPAHEPPPEKLVIFLYNLFRRPLIAHLLRRIESSLETTSRELYIVYYNPSGPMCSTRQPLLNAASLPNSPTTKRNRLRPGRVRCCRSEAKSRQPTPVPTGQTYGPSLHHRCRLAS